MDNEKKKKVNNTKARNNSNQKKGNENKKTNNFQSKNQKENTTKTNNKKDNNIKNKKEDKIINENIEKKEIEIKEEKKEEKQEEIVETKKESLNNTIIEDKPNKTGLIVLLAILLIIVGICIFYQVDNKKDSNKDVSTEESNEIMDDFYKYFNSKKTKIIYYASSTCGYCSLETPIMEQISKDYDIDYLHIDSSKLTKSDREKMLKELNIKQATPTTVIVKNGEIIDTQVGYLDGGAMVEFLKDNKILDKDAVYTPEQYITFINYDEYNKILKQEGKHIITIGQTGCSHCIATKPVLNAIAKDYDITINYLNLTDMNQSEHTSFTNSLSEIGYDDEDFVSSGSFGTPLTLIIENGKVISYVNGERPTAQYIRSFKKAGIITE